MQSVITEVSEKQELFQQPTKKRYWTVGFLLQEVFTSTSLICFGMFRQPFPVQMLHGHTPSTALSAPVMDVQRCF